MHKITVMYPQGRFDEEYYVNHHGPLLAKHAEALGLRRFAFDRNVTNPDGSPAPYQVIAHLYFDDADAVKRAMRSPEMGEAVRDIKNFFDGQVQVLVSEVVEPAVRA